MVVATDDGKGCGSEDVGGGEDTNDGGRIEREEACREERKEMGCGVFTNLSPTLSLKGPNCPYVLYKKNCV